MSNLFVKLQEVRHNNKSCMYLNDVNCLHFVEYLSLLKTKFLVNRKCIYRKFKIGGNHKSRLKQKISDKIISKETKHY